jgi:hypothetical protein
MAEINFNKIFNDAFGYTPDTREVKIEQAPARLEHSNLGQPYYDTDILGREFFMPIRLNGILVSFAVVACVWKKTFVSTGMPERGGTVKELISIDDFAINIKGILVNPGNEWVEAGVVEMFNLFKVNASVELRSALTDIFLSGKSDDNGNDAIGHRVVIKEIKWPAVSGVEHAKPFEIDCESDLIFELEIQ